MKCHCFNIIRWKEMQWTEIEQVYLIIEMFALKVKSYKVLQDKLSCKCDLKSKLLKTVFSFIGG